MLEGFKENKIIYIEFLLPVLLFKDCSYIPHFFKISLHQERFQRFIWIYIWMMGLEISSQLFLENVVI